MSPFNARHWDERIARAVHLATEYAASSEVLTFYAGLAGYQKSLAANPPDLEDLVAATPQFLGWLRRSAPRRLAEGADEMSRDAPADWRRLLDSCWRTAGRDVNGANEMQIFCVEALLQPIAEATAAGTPVAQTLRSAWGGTGVASGFSRTSVGGVTDVGSGFSRTSTCCPICTGLPIAAVLREEGQGARRALVCGFCLAEWNYPRVVCPACGEQRFEALSVYTVDQLAHVRVDACETCRSYVKTIDLTKDALAVPIVDELSSIALDLWARERGYTKLRPNLLRM